jgi:hypothetical protein
MPRQTQRGGCPPAAPARPNPTPHSPRPSRMALVPLGSFCAPQGPVAGGPTAQWAPTFTYDDELLHVDVSITDLGYHLVEVEEGGAE